MKWKSKPPQTAKGHLIAGNHLREGFSIAQRQTGTAEMDQNGSAEVLSVPCDGSTEIRAAGDIAGNQKGCSCTSHVPCTLLWASFYNSHTRNTKSPSWEPSSCLPDTPPARSLGRYTPEQKLFRCVGRSPFPFTSEAWVTTTQLVNHCLKLYSSRHVHFNKSGKSINRAGQATRVNGSVSEDIS